MKRCLLIGRFISGGGGGGGWRAGGGVNPKRKEGGGIDRIVNESIKERIQGAENGIEASERGFIFYTGTIELAGIEGHAYQPRHTSKMKKIEYFFRSKLEVNSNDFIEVITFSSTSGDKWINYEAVMTIQLRCICI